MTDTPSYTIKRKTITQTFQLRPWDNDDVAIERILSDWADNREKNKNIKAAIGVFHALQRGDIGYFEDNHKSLVSEIQLEGRREMQTQIDNLRQEIIALRKRQNTHSTRLDDNQLSIDGNNIKIAQNRNGVYAAYKMFKRVEPLLQITVTGQGNNKLADGKE